MYAKESRKKKDIESYMLYSYTGLLIICIVWYEERYNVFFFKEM